MPSTTTSAAPPKPSAKLTMLHNRRARGVAVMVLAVLLALCLRMVQLQVFGGSAAAAARQERLTKVPLIAQRGTITDSTGVPMAQSVERRNIFIDQTKVGLKRTVNGQDREGVDQAAEDLAGALGVTKESLLPKLQGNRRFMYIAKNVMPDVWRKVQTLKIPAIASQKTYVRVYPGGVVGGSLLGFVSGSPDGVSTGSGQAGVEAMEQGALAGSNGSMTYEAGLNGQLIPSTSVQEQPQTDGSKVSLTVDSALQFYAQQAITAQVQATRAQWGSVVVMDPKTGNILALADSPSVDPAKPGATPAADRGSNALGAIFEPGSTAKLITAAAALQEGAVHQKDRFEIGSSYKASNGQKVVDAEKHGKEKLTLSGILAQSSNIGTAMVGTKLSKDTRYRYLKDFGMGQPTGLGFPGESSGILHPVSDWDDRTGITVLFGQGVASTSLQAVEPFATIANNGVRMAPRLVNTVTAPDGRVTTTPQRAATDVVSPKTAGEVRQMLSGVTNTKSKIATGTAAAIPGYQVAGKTGTSQAPYKGGYSGYTSSFVGMVPADDPKLVVGVFLQRPKKGYFGGTVAAPVFKDVTQYALKHYRIPPSRTPYPLLPTKY